jgi:molybdopterin-binding protein
MVPLEAKVIEINKKDMLHLVAFELDGIVLSMVSLELPHNLKIESKVKLAIKPISVAIGKDTGGILSYSNQLPATLLEMEKGELLSNLTLELDNHSKIESIITTRAVDRLALKKGDSVTALIKASEISILEVLND